MQYSTNINTDENPGNENRLLKQFVTLKSVELNNLVAGYQQTIGNLSTSWEQAMRTHPVHKLLEQHCYKSAASLLQLGALQLTN
jgi:hypothetical protein